MYDLKKIRGQVNALIDEGEAIMSLAKAEDRELTAEEKSRLLEIYGEKDKPGMLDNARKEEERAEHYHNQLKLVAARRAAEGRTLEETGDGGSVTATAIKLPAMAKRSRSRAYQSVEDAYAMGQFINARVFGNEVSARWIEDHRSNEVLAAHSTGNNEKGGYAVPETMEASIVRLVEEYGVFRGNSFVYPMPSASVLIPRRTGGFTSYFVGENDAITASDLTLNQAKLDAKKLAVLTQVSSELNEDAIVALADLITMEIAYAFANKEDECGFNGDGTSTYGGITGLKSALAAGSIQDAATGNDSALSLDLADFEAAVGKLPMFPGIQPRWYMHKAVYWASAARLMDAAGGNTSMNLGNGPETTFLGYPVTFSQVMPSTTGTLASTIVAYFGDIRMASTFGTRRGVSIRSDESVYFTSDAIAIRATERFDINVHERGTASAAGPVVALKTAS